MPVPLMVRGAPTSLVMVKADPPALNTIELTSVGSVGVMFLRCEVAKVAVSAGPFGTVAGVQFAALLQLPLIGLKFQVALPAKTAFSAPSASVRMMAQDRMRDFMSAVMPMALFASKADSSQLWHHR